MASQMTIGKKLFSSFGACVALTLAVGGTSLWLISSLGSSINKVAHVTARKQFLAAEIDGAESNMLAAERGILIRSMMKDAALMPNVDNYLGAHGFMDSPAINRQELLNDIRVLEQTYAEGKRLHDMGISIDDVPKHWHFGENATLFFADAALPDITAIYWELDNKLPACPPCRPRRWQGGGDTAILPVK